MKPKPENVKIWDPVNLYGDWEIGEGTRIGAFCDIGGKVGRNCIVQCHVSIPPGVIIEDNCFIGPGVRFANDKYPPSNKLEKTFVRKGASIGMGALIGPGITIGEKAIVGMGAVVLQDISEREIWFGNPARRSGIRNLTRP